MRKFILGLAVMFASVGVSYAGDLALKAPRVFNDPCMIATATTPLSCSGWYIGGGLSGQGSNANIIGNGINGSVFAGGMVMSADGGYQYMQGNWIFGGELDVGYAFNSNVTLNGVGSNVNGMRVTEFFKVGGNLGALLGTQAPITIPASLSNSILGPYVGIGSSQWQVGNGWASGMTSGAGVLFDISPRLFGDLRYTYTDFRGAVVNGIAVQNDQALRVSINYKLN